MSTEPSKSALVRRRLLGRARVGDEDSQALLTRYVPECFLYRLGQSAHRGSTPSPRQRRSVLSLEKCAQPGERGPTDSKNL